MIATGSINGFRTTGLSLNVDYHPNSKLVCRIEGRWLNSKDEIFVKNSGFSNNNIIFATSIAIKFGD
jgi:hypothetical protein